MVWFAFFFSQSQILFCTLQINWICVWTSQAQEWHFILYWLLKINLTNIWFAVKLLWIILPCAFCLFHLLLPKLFGQMRTTCDFGIDCLSLRVFLTTESMMSLSGLVISVRGLFSVLVKIQCWNSPCVCVLYVCLSLCTVRMSPLRDSRDSCYKQLRPPYWPKDSSE